MRDARIAVGIGIVVAVLTIATLAGAESAPALATFLTGLTTGLFAATSAFAVLGYRQTRDPSLLLVAAGAGAVALVAAGLGAVLFFVSPDFGPDFPRRVGYLGLAGLLALTGNLVAIVPLRDRRGRPPLRPRTVVLATLTGVAAYIALVVALPIDVLLDDLSGGFGPLAPVTMAALAAGGAAITIRRSVAADGSRGSSGPAPRSWCSAPGRCLVLSQANVDVIQIGALWTELGRGLSSIALVGFVLASLTVEASRARRATDRAAEVMEGRAEIAATIAHDVRGPVGTIKGLATTTRKSYDRLGDPERLEFIGMIEQESGRLLRLVDQVAMALKIDAGALDLHRRTQAVEPMLLHAVTRIETDREVSILAARELQAAIDTRWFAEAVAQGVDNALRFSPPDTSVHVRAHADGPRRRRRDRGRRSGIDPEQREVLFGKFSRWRPSGYEDRTGSGLGLFICRGIARTHGGDATLDAATTGGTMLRFRVPVDGDGG